MLRFPEPTVYYYESNAPTVAPLLGAEEITFYYPDGAHDCEAMVIDPLSGDLFLMSKETNSTRRDADLKIGVSRRTGSA